LDKRKASGGGGAGQVAVDKWKERFAQTRKEPLTGMLSPEIAAEEEASRGEDSGRARDWASGWLRAHGMNLKLAEALEQERRKHCSRGTINRWFDELLLQSDGRIDASFASVPRDEESVEGFECHAPEIALGGD
jgi:hypothetical protein